MVFGFGAGMCTEHISLTLQLLTERATEWPISRALWIICADILQAFDHVSPDTLASCLEFWGFPAGLTRCMVMQSLFTNARAVEYRSCVTPSFLDESLHQAGWDGEPMGVYAGHSYCAAQGAGALGNDSWCCSTSPWTCSHVGLIRQPLLHRPLCGNRFATWHIRFPMS